MYSDVTLSSETLILKLEVTWESQDVEKGDLMYKN